MSEKSLIAKKGFLKLNIKQIDSEYYGSRNYTLTLRTQVGHQLRITRNQIDKYISNKDVYFPVCQNVEILFSENAETDTREGYFCLPLSKIYQFPQKNHLINVNCIWREKPQNNIENGNTLSARVKVNIVFLESQKATLAFEILSANLKESVKKQIEEKQKVLDLYVEVKVDGISNRTTVKSLQAQQESLNWNETLVFKLQSIPPSIQIILKDKDMVNDETFAIAEINPCQEEYFTAVGQKTQRQTEVKSEGSQSIASLKVITNFQLQ